ncbi:S46 family peptidase, partial [Escherichia coli]|nr:S46 family peptidase [Escherichia coli]
QLEGEMLSKLVSLYQVRVKKEAQSKTLASSNASELANLAYASIFANKQSATQFLNNPDRLKIDGDKLYQWANAYITDQRLQMETYVKVEEAFDKNTRLFL